MTRIRTLVGALMVMGLALGVAGTAVAQDSGSIKAPYLRVEWQLESTRGAFRNVCGRVFNEREVAARNVVILFEGLDNGGQPVSRRFGEVIGGVPAGSYSIFCLMVPAKGETYRVTVPAVDWGFNAP